LISSFPWLAQALIAQLREAGMSTQADTLAKTTAEVQVVAQEKKGWGSASDDHKSDMDFTDEAFKLQQLAVAIRTQPAVLGQECTSLAFKSAHQIEILCLCLGEVTTHATACDALYAWGMAPHPVIGLAGRVAAPQKRALLESTDSGRWFGGSNLAGHGFA
jgi:hypothetical protein